MVVAAVREKGGVDKKGEGEKSAAGRGIRVSPRRAGHLCEAGSN